MKMKLRAYGNYDSQQVKADHTQVEAARMSYNSLLW